MQHLRTDLCNCLALQTDGSALSNALPAAISIPPEAAHWAKVGCIVPFLCARAPQLEYCLVLLPTLLAAYTLPKRVDDKACMVPPFTGAA
jgi:hypothetical protein